MIKTYVKCWEMCLVNKKENSTRNGNYKMSVSLLIIFEERIFYLETPPPCNVPWSPSHATSHTL